MERLAEYIKQYYDRNYSLLPLRDKKPIIKWNSLQKQRAEAEDIYDWFLKYHNFNVGILTGSRLAVLDIDDPDHFKQWQTQNKAIFPETTKVRTGRGFHYWYAIDKNVRSVTNEAFEIKGTGSYIVAPPSMHPSGKSYEFIIPLDNIKPLPAWLFDLAKNQFKVLPTFNSKSLTHHTGDMDCIDQMLDLDVSIGQRNNVFYILINTLKKFNKPSYSEHIVMLKNTSLKTPLPVYHLQTIFKTFYENMSCNFIMDTLPFIHCEDCTFNKRGTTMLEKKLTREIFKDLTPAQWLIYQEISQHHISNTSELSKHLYLSRQTIVTAKKVFKDRGLINHEHSLY